MQVSVIPFPSEITPASVLVPAREMRVSYFCSTVALL